MIYIYIYIIPVLTPSNNWMGFCGYRREVGLVSMLRIYVIVVVNRIKKRRPCENRFFGPRAGARASRS